MLCVCVLLLFFATVQIKGNRDERRPNETRKRKKDRKKTELEMGAFIIFEQ